MTCIILFFMASRCAMMFFVCPFYKAFWSIIRSLDAKDAMKDCTPTRRLDMLMSCMTGDLNYPIDSPGNALYSKLS